MNATIEKAYSSKSVHYQDRGVLSRHIRRVPPRHILRATAIENEEKVTFSVESALDQLKRAAKRPGTVPAAEVLSAILKVEKEKLKLDNLETLISDPKQRWKLIYIAGEKDVQNATKGKATKGGQYLPAVACQRFDGANKIFTNGIFLGTIAYLTVEGPYIVQQRILNFDVDKMVVGLGPLTLPFTLKKRTPLEELDKGDVKKLPFFVYAYVDEDIVVARGRSGGVALWASADAEWQASAGVLQVYK